jgi:heme-degrading monooxygenase HmoA
MMERRPAELAHMIARIWRGITLAEKADAYIDYLHQTGLRDYATTPGNRGVSVLRRLQGEHSEIVLISLWDSMEAVRAFAGENPERSVYYPEDENYLLEMEPLVRHYEVAEQIVPADAPAPPAGSGTKKAR